MYIYLYIDLFIEFSVGRAWRPRAASEKAEAGPATAAPPRRASPAVTCITCVQVLGT